MKQFIYSILFVVATILCREVQAQQRAQYSMYIMNNYVLNPAAGGINNFWDVKVGFRNQWTGLEGAPKTLFASMHGPIGYPNKRVRNGHLRAHHGVGGYVYRDVTGPLSMTGAYLSYSYHIKLSSKYTASTGAFLGIMQYSLDGSKLVFVQTPDDPSVSSSKINKVLPDGTVGIWVHSEKLFFGVSVNQIFGNRTNFTTYGTSDGRLNYHYFGTIGYKVKLNQDLDFIPSIMAKYVQAAPVQVDVNARVKYKNMIWGGVSYRKTDAFAIMAGFMINNKFDVGYAYDLTTSRLRAGSYGSHEIIVGYNFASLSMKPRRVLCPMDYWN